MNISTIIKMIEATPRAMCEAKDFSEYVSGVFGRIEQSGRTLSLAQSVELLAGYIWSALDWNLALDPAAKADAAKLGAQPRSRIAVIKQLERIGEIFGWDLKPGRKQPKLKDRPISGDVLAALEKKGALGPLLVSFPDPLDGRPREELKFLELGEKSVDTKGRTVPEEHDSTVFGFHDPSHLTSDAASNSRKLKRKFALASKSGMPASLRVDEVTWKLDELPRQALNEAEPYASGIFASLEAVRDILPGKKTLSERAGLSREEKESILEARKNLAITSRRAARFLEIEFHMTDRNTNNQSEETIASWTRPSPFLEFGRTIFELLAPTRSGEGLSEIVMPGDVRGDLQETAVDTALEGAKRARRVLRVLKWKLRWRGIRLAKAELVDPRDRGDDDRVPVNAHYLDRGSPVMSASEHQRNTAGRLEAGRQRVLEQLWSLRDNAVKLRAFAEMFYAYHSALLERGGNYGPLRNEMLERIINPTLDWYRELTARFDEGVVYEADRKKRRSGGLPNEVPPMPTILEHHRMELKHYPELMSSGAQREDVVIEAILEALDPSGQALTTWRQVSSIVDDSAGAA